MLMLGIQPYRKSTIEKKKKKKSYNSIFTKPLQINSLCNLSKRCNGPKALEFSYKNFLCDLTLFTTPQNFSAQKKKKLFAWFLQMNSLAKFRFSMVWMNNNSSILILGLKFKARNSQTENMKTIPLGEIVIL